MNKYEKLDKLIIGRLQQGAATFTQLSSNRLIEDEAEIVAIPDRIGRKCGWRVVDRRLQALRKLELIKYSRAEGWSCV